MSKKKAQGKKNHKINKIEQTDELLTGRGGLNLFVRYLDKINIMSLLLLPMFSHLQKSKKGVAVKEILKQILCLFLDGTSIHLTHFDRLKKDPAYAAVIESSPEDMISSHTAKRFFRKFTWPLVRCFRRIHIKFFQWRLKITKPEAIILDLDAMVMGNDQAEQREGVKPTYKKIKGFNALKLTWKGLIVDAIFRSGEKHSNSGSAAKVMIQRVVKAIRQGYDSDVPIIIHMDSGFMDQKLFKVCEKLGIGYICGGKLYTDIKDEMAKIPPEDWETYFAPGKNKEDRMWEYKEFEDQRGSWDESRRAIFTRPMSEDGQLLLPFTRPCTVIYTNLGKGYAVDEQLRNHQMEWLLTTYGIIYCYHDRGCSELTFRGFKDFGTEQMPFQKFILNAGFFHLMVLGFNLYEAFKEDVCQGEISLTSYPETLRRKIIDIGAKIVRTSHKNILKLSKATFASLNISKLWTRSNNPPIFQLA